MKCTSCGHDFEQVEGIEFCPHCGARIEQVQVAKICAWEDRGKYGFVDALLKTWKESTINPARFFKTVPPRGNMWNAFFYGILISFIAGLFGYFWNFVFSFGSFRIPGAEASQFEHMFRGGFLILMIVLSPIFITIGFFIITAIFHLLLLIEER